MVNIKNLSNKELAAVLYVYYLENYCQSDFSFDNGKLRKEIEKYYNSLPSEIKDIEELIQVYDCEGTDYDSYEFSFKDRPELFLQVTSLVDYDGNSPEGYDGSGAWADVGMFWENGEVCDFDLLKERDKFADMSREFIHEGVLNEDEKVLKALKAACNNDEELFNYIVNQIKEELEPEDERDEI